MSTTGAPSGRAPPPPPADSLALTPLRAHYLKRELVTLQFTAELLLLNDSPSALSLLGPPFLPHSRFVNGLPLPPPPPGSREALEEARRTHEMDDSLDLPFLQFVFNHFVLTFPFLANCPPTFFSHKLQPFVYSFISRNIGTIDDDDEGKDADPKDGTSKRKKLAGKVEKHLGLVMSAAIKITENDGHEEVVRVESDGSTYIGVPVSQQQDGPTLPKPHALGAKVNGKKKEEEFAINVVAVRNVVIKGRVRNSVHEEFILRTRKAGEEDVYVARRYGDFTRLAETLRKECVEADIRSPPSKDRRTTEVRVSPPASPRTSVDAATFSSYDATSPVSPIPTQGPMPTLSRERNRLTLRAYLRTLLAMPEVAVASAFQSFLVESPIVLTPVEMKDVALREEMDKVREEEVRQFREEVEERVRELERGLRGFREELVKSDGLSRVFGTIRETAEVADLPIEYRKVLEWARISLASTVYQLFLGSDTSSATFASLKRTHSIMPYFMMRSILRISNPISMIRSILDLFLARPFGATSLLQKIFTGGLLEEVRDLREQTDRVVDKVNDAAMVAKVKDFVDAPKDLQDAFLAEAVADNQDIMTVILRSSSDTSPPLGSTAIQRVQRSSVAYAEYKFYRDDLSDKEDDEGPADEEGWLFEDLHVLMRLLRKARDKEQMVELIFEGSTSEMLKDIVTIFYEPLAKVYKAANIADSLYDLQLFIGDLIKTVEQAEEANLSDPQRTVQIFVDLVARHEARFYHFVHQVHSKGEGLFDNLMKWIELFINFIRNGLPSPISLEFLLPVGGHEREEVMKEVDGIIDYHRRIKGAHQERMRRRMIRGEANGGDALDESRQGDAAFVEGVMQNMRMGGVMGDVEEFKDEDSEEENWDEEGSSGEEDFQDATDSPSTSLPAKTIPTGPKALPAIPGSLIVPIQAKPSRSKGRRKEPIALPTLKLIPTLVPVFVELVRGELAQTRRLATRRLPDLPVE